MITNPSNLSEQLLNLTEQIAVEMNSLRNSINTKLDYTEIIPQAQTLAIPRKINGTDFNGSEDITTSSWGEEREITIVDADGSNSGAVKKINGSEDFSLVLPSIIKATLLGNATSATTAESASYAAKAGTADSATTATSAETAENATLAANANYATSAGSASTATSATNANYATSAGSATSATKATQDSSGQTITSTYIKSASVSGTTVTFTRGNGTTFAITTQDTNTDTNTSCWTLSGGTNGWARDNSTGFCIQWGLVTLGARGDYSFTFPRAFSVVYSMSTIGGPQTNYRTNYTALTHLQALTNTGGTLLSASEDAVAILTNCRYIATGYV
jgi:hypothetical protein